MKIKEIKGSEKIYFKPMHKLYGHAEFVLCPVWFRGKIKELYITTQQQEPHRQFKVISGFSDQLYIDSWTHKGIDNPKIWLIGKCQEHKTQFIRIYVPINSNFIEVHIGSDLGLTFGYDEGYK